MLRFHPTMVLAQPSSSEKLYSGDTCFHPTMVLAQLMKLKKEVCYAYVSIPLWFSLNPTQARIAVVPDLFPSHYGSRSTETVR